MAAVVSGITTPSPCYPEEEERLASADRNALPSAEEPRVELFGEADVGCCRDPEKSPINSLQNSKAIGLRWGNRLSELTSASC